MVTTTDNSAVINRALKDFKSRQKGYQLTTDYYDGKHKLAFATNKFQESFGSMFKAFADNLCPSVVDAVKEKLVLVGFGIESGTSDGSGEPTAENTRTAAAAWDIWKANRMDKRAGEVHREMLKNGDGYVVVWPDKDNIPRIYPNKAATMTVAYDAENPQWITWAAKWWKQEDDKIRLTLYFPNAIYKYITAQAYKGSTLPDKAEAFSPYDIIPDEEWPLENPHGQVPVFHFGNNADTGEFGRSELTDVIPLQNALNKSVADMLVSDEYGAFPQRWIVGHVADIDPDTGQPKKEFLPGPGMLWGVGNDQAKFGQFDSADLQHYITEQETFRTEIARVSHTPLHYITPSRDWPSGEALKTAEAPFTSKVEDRQISAGNVWEDVLRLALKMQGNDSDFRLTALWKDPAPRSEKEFWESAPLKQDAGVPKSQVQREYGYSEEEIEKFKAEKADEAQAGAEMLTAAFDRGRIQE